MTSRNPPLLAAAALAALLAGCQGSLAYELLQAAKGNNAPPLPHRKSNP